jgi:ketosteroid isomerase-like protein
MKMRSVIALAGLAISFAFPIYAQDQNAVDPKTRQEVEAVEMQIVEAYNKHDAAAVAALYTHDAVRVDNPRPPVGTALLVGRKAMEKRFETEFTWASWSSSPAVGKLVQMYAFEDSIATISEWSIGQYNGHSVKIFVRDADTWKIRMEYYSIAPVVTH